MPLLRLLFAALVALAAAGAVFFTAAVVLLTGALGWVAQLVRGKRPPVRASVNPPPPRPVRMNADDVIDVVATKVPEKTGGR